MSWISSCAILRVCNWTSVPRYTGTCKWLAMQTHVNGTGHSLNVYNSYLMVCIPIMARYLWFLETATTEGFLESFLCNASDTNLWWFLWTYRHGNLGYCLPPPNVTPPRLTTMIPEKKALFPGGGGIGGAPLVSHDIKRMTFANAICQTGALATSWLMWLFPPFPELPGGLLRAGGWREWRWWLNC